MAKKKSAKTSKKTTKAATVAVKPPTKSEIHAHIAEKTELTKKQVGEVFDALYELIEENLKKEPREFNLPGMMKIEAQFKEKQEPRPVRNPATGETIMSQAKPDRYIVKIRPLKQLKEAVDPNG